MTSAGQAVRDNLLCKTQTLSFVITRHITTHHLGDRDYEN